MLLGSSPASLSKKVNLFINRVTWIGYPLNAEPVINELLSGREISNNRNFGIDLYTRLEKKEYQSAFELINSEIKLNPHDLFLYESKFCVLLKINEDSAYRFARELLNNLCKDSKPVLYYMARDIVDKKFELIKPDWDLVIDLSERALALSKDDRQSANILKTLAQCYIYMGNYKKSTEALEKAYYLLST